MNNIYSLNLSILLDMIKSKPSLKYKFKKPRFLWLWSITYFKIKLISKLKTFKPKLYCEKEFWYIIELFDWQFVGDDDKVTKVAINYLSNQSSDAIELFDKILKDKLSVLEQCFKYKAINSKDEVIMELMNKPEAYLYVRCAILAAGKKYYQAVLNNPAKIKENTEFRGLEQMCSRALKKSLINKIS